MDVLYHEGKEEKVSTEALQFEERVIWLSGEIKESAAQALIDKLLILNRRNKRKPIRLFINSYGGYTACGFAIVDCIMGIRAHVHTVAVGAACSAASKVLMAGEVGKRVALPNTKICVHPTRWSTKDATPTEWQDQAESMRQIEKRSLNLLIARTKLSATEAEKVIKRETYLTARQAQKMGIIDRVVKHIR